MTSDEFMNASREVGGDGHHYDDGRMMQSKVKSKDS
jgi:hypothetical protein